MEFHDKVLKCSECNSEFVFTAGEQMFFADKGFKNEPKRCKACKAKRAEGVGGGANGGGGSAPMRSETKTTCSQCGKDTTVPFRPTQGRPVFCRECFQPRRAMGAGSCREYVFLTKFVVAFVGAVAVAAIVVARTLVVKSPVGARQAVPVPPSG